MGECRRVSIAAVKLDKMAGGVIASMDLASGVVLPQGRRGF